jgi:hypothetical protein
MPHAFEHILSIRDEVGGLSDAAIIDALLKSTEESSETTIMVKNLIAAEAVERGLDADDPIIDFPNVTLACGDADLSVARFLPEEMQERAMGAIVKGESLPLEIVIANHGFELRLQPPRDEISDKPSITHRIRRTVDRFLSPEEIEKRLEQRGEQWCVIAETSGRNMGCYDSREAAEERLGEIERFAKAETFSPPNGVKSAAKRALEWIREGEQGDGFTMTGRARAAQLARGDAVSLETIKRMNSFFSRHEPDKKAEGFSLGEDGYPSPGRVAWDAWGGDAGARWAASIVNRVAKNDDYDENYETSEPILNERQKAMYVAYERIAEMLGPWDAGVGPNGAHYMDKHPFVDQGMICGNCAFYEGPGRCEILNQKVNALGVCKLWIIPEAMIASQDIAEKANALANNSVGADNNSTLTMGGFNADAVIDQIGTGGTASVEPDNVGAIFARMAERDDMPDVTELHIKNTSLIGGEGLGFSREDMPQISPNMRSDFMGKMQSSNSIATTMESVDPRNLRPTQRAINGRTAGRIYLNYRAEGIPDSERIIVTRDNYIIDGHHTWAAAVAIAFDGGAETIPVYRIDSDHRTVLDAAHNFVAAMGEALSADNDQTVQKNGALWFEYEIEKANPYRDRKSGQFTFAPGRATSIGGTARRAGDSSSPALMYESAYPGATGGYNAGIPTSISEADSPVGEKLDPTHSLWHHLEKNPNWDGRDPAQQYRVTPERQRLHEKLVNDAVSPVKPVPEGEEKVFVMLGGGPAAGKSSGLTSGAFGGVPKDHVEVNPDEVKGKLPEFDPLRTSSSQIEFKAAASFVHEESSMVAKMQQRAAIAKGTHLVVDGTGDGKPGSLEAKVGAARGAGYTVLGRYATLDTNAAWERAVERSKGPSRRYVNQGVLRGTHRAVTPSYINAANTGLFDDLSLIWTGGPKGSIPILVHTATGGARGTSQTIVNASQWAAFQAKAT